MSETLSRDELIQAIDIELVNIPVVLRMAEIAVKHSDEVTNRIFEGRKEDQLKLDDAIYHLRRAGLLID